MSRIFCLLLFILPATAFAGDEKPSATANLGDRTMTFGPGLEIEAEGYALALFGSCLAENDDRIANEEHWKKALKSDHVLIKFGKARRLTTAVRMDEFEALELLIPVSINDSPDHVYVRNGEKIRAFAKYQHDACVALQNFLRKLVNAPPIRLP